MDSMKQMIIVINGIHDVYEFIRQASQVDGDILLQRGKNTVDAKSVLGVFAIDPSEPTIIVYPSTATEFEKYISQYKKEQI